MTAKAMKAQEEETNQTPICKQPESTFYNRLKRQASWTHPQTCTKTEFKKISKGCHKTQGRVKTMKSKSRIGSNDESVVF